MRSSRKLVVTASMRYIVEHETEWQIRWIANLAAGSEAAQDPMSHLAYSYMRRMKALIEKEPHNFPVSRPSANGMRMFDYVTRETGLKLLDSMGLAGLPVFLTEREIEKTDVQKAVTALQAAGKGYGQKAVFEYFDKDPVLRLLPRNNKQVIGWHEDITGGLKAGRRSKLTKPAASG